MSTSLYLYLFLFIIFPSICFCLFLFLSIILCFCLPLFVFITFVYFCLLLFDFICFCPMSTFICFYLLLFASFYFCMPMSSVCFYLFQYASICMFFLHSRPLSNVYFCQSRLHLFLSFILCWFILFCLCFDSWIYIPILYFLFPCVSIIFKYCMLEVWNLGLLGYRFVLCVCACALCV